MKKIMFTKSNLMLITDFMLFNYFVVFKVAWFLNNLYYYVINLFMLSFQIVYLLQRRTIRLEKTRLTGPNIAFFHFSIPLIASFPSSRSPTNVH